MTRRRNHVIAFAAGLALLLAGCAAPPPGGYARYGEPEPLRLDLMLEGLAHVALFGLFVWAGHAHYHDGHFGYWYGHHGHHGGHHGGHH